MSFWGAAIILMGYEHALADLKERSFQFYLETPWTILHISNQLDILAI